jgi:hypothetical protein
LSRGEGLLAGESFLAAKIAKRITSDSLRTTIINHRGHRGPQGISLSGNNYHEED